MFDAMLKENQFRKEYPERLLKIMHLALKNNFKMQSFIQPDAVLIVVGDDDIQFQFLLDAPEILAPVDMESIDDEMTSFCYELTQFVEKQKESERQSLVFGSALGELTVEERKVLGL
jgi:hypothetical protein